MERNVERLAWTVLFAAFATFCLALIAVPTGVNWYLASAMAEHPVKLEVLKGTALWLPAGGRQEVNAGSRLSLGSGEQVRTSEDSEVLLSFFDGSNVRLWPNTTIRIVSAKSTAYRQTASELVLTQDSGHARYEVAIPVTTSRLFEVQTPQADALLRDGSYKVEIAPNNTVLSVGVGSATVSAGQRSIEVLKGERTSVATAETPTPPRSSVHNLVDNGDFSHKLDGWRPGNRDLGDSTPGNVSIQEDSNRTFVEFTRERTTRRAETFIHAAVNQDVTDFGMLKFSFQLRIQDQDPGNDVGQAGAYPLAVRIHYRDSSGTEATWTQGFYSTTDSAMTAHDARRVTRSFWTDESFDLLDPGVVSPRPAAILWIEFAATGQGFQSDLGNVQLLVD